MWRAVFALPLTIMIIWAWNLEPAPQKMCLSWEEVTVTMHGWSGSHFGPYPRKMKQCTEWVDISE